VFVLYNIMKRDSGTGYSKGGARSLSEYMGWVDAVAKGIGAHAVIAIVEPDAVNDLYNMKGADRRDRVLALRYAIARLSSNPQAAVYLDAGTVGINAAPIAARLLRDVGFNGLQGVSLNVSNFQLLSDVLSYGDEISRLTGGLHYVVDTSRNGNGSLPHSEFEYWCNPPGRAIGVDPTLTTGHQLADAYLWIKQPGNSDGECRGFPPSGTWVESYAIALGGGT
jgi:endoglucanase